MTVAEFEKQTNDYQECEKELESLIQKRYQYTANALEMRAQEIKIKDQVFT